MTEQEKEMLDAYKAEIKRLTDALHALIDEHDGDVQARCPVCNRPTVTIKDGKFLQVPLKAA